MKHYPLIFGPHGGLVAGNGFIAHVVIRGRCLLEETDPEFVSVLGVNPGAVAGDGANMGEAYHDYLENVKLNVLGIAAEAEDFDDFKAQVQHFVRETNEPNGTLWQAAVAAVRAGEIDLEGVRREDADSAFWVEVEPIALDDDHEKAVHHPLGPALNEPSATREDFKLVAA